MSTISLSLAKPGKAMPGPYSSLMVLRRRASRSGAGRAVRGTKSGDNADGALIRLLTSNKDSGTRRSAVHATVRSKYVRSRVHAGIVSPTTWATIQRRVASRCPGSDLCVADSHSEPSCLSAADSSVVLSQDIVETDHMHNILTES